MHGIISKMPNEKNDDNSPQPDLDELIPLSQAAKQYGLSPGYLRILVREGEIWGKKIGRNWVTTGAAVREYQARGIRPGRPKKEKPDQSKRG